jgi:4-hydroxy 2-oxovalerate aldolase
MKPIILDCTLRDGGLVNNFYFSDEFVRDLYHMNIETGIDYMEFGYKASEKIFDSSMFGKWKFTSEKSVREIVGENNSSLKLVAMVDIGRTEKTDLIPKNESVFDMMRIATYSSDIPAALDMIEYCHNLGYETTVNIMAVSDNSTNEIKKYLHELFQSSVDVIYLVDSFGAFFPENITELAALYGSESSIHKKQLGIHAHNNQQMAFANTIEAYRCGIAFLDATVNGMGRGAGNCSMEMLFGYLESRNFTYNKAPVLEFIEKHILPMQEQGFCWGYDIPYLLTGQKKVHPSRAIKFIQDGNVEYSKMFREME